MQKRFKLLSLVSFLMIFMLFLTIPKTYAYTYLGSSYGDDFSPYLNMNNLEGTFSMIEADDIWIDTSYGDFCFNKQSDFDSQILTIYEEDFTYENAPQVSIYWNSTTVKWQLERIELVDGKPVYSGETAFITNVDNPLTLENILSKIKLIDNEDGDVSHTITVVNDGYTANKLVLGTYVIELTGHDLSNNVANLSVSVLVKDGTAPVITGTKSYNQSYTSKKDVSSILSALSVTDNYDSVAPVIKVKTDNYSSNYNRVGTYTIVFYAVDTSTNEGTYTVTINVIDNVAPVFTGPKTILKGQSETLTIETIKSQISVNDAVDGVLTFTVKSDGYTGNGHRVGIYDIVFESIDKSGNVGIHTLTITVKDNIPPVFYVDNYFITVEQSVNLTQQDIIDLLVASGQLVINSSTKIDFIQNEYEGNEKTPGIYAISLKSSSTDGSSNVYSVAVLVEETNDGIILEPDLTFFQKVGKFFGSIWTWVKTPTIENGNFYKGYYLLIGFGVITAVYFSKKFFGKKRRW